ncbi:MAG: type VII toxin-antitoxin system HepT family RNase toxin [Pseudoalteromonas tetraodonis]
MQELDELSQVDQLNNRDYRAAERLLQLMTEVCISLSKHWLKKYKNTTSSNAYQTFSELTQLGALTDNELLSWRKIIGLRNALVHDYLNIDQEIVKTIIKNQHYVTMHLFSQKAMAELAS